MTEVVTRVTQLRETAEQMKRSSLLIERSVEDVQDIVRYLFAIGYHSAGSAQFALLYNDQLANMENWAQTVRRFAENLGQAADDIEQATSNHLDEIVASAGSISMIPALRWLYLGIKEPVANSGDIQALRAAGMNAAAPTLPLGQYVSTANRPLYDFLVGQREALTTEQNHITALVTERQKLSEDLTSLKNRMLSFDPQGTPSQSPRVQALQDQITALDQQINQSETNINRLRSNIDDLTQRLNRVAPGAGADLSVIADLEGGQSASWLMQNTKDCVNYVVSKIPIPDNLARDAYLWVQQASAHPEWGITSGSTPLTGSVLVMTPQHPYADDVFGHLMVVERVENGEIWVTDNVHASAVRLSALTTEVTGGNIRYLYLPWYTRA